MIKTMTAWNRRVLIASALVLLSPSAWSEDEQIDKDPAETITVTAPSQQLSTAAEKIEPDLNEQIEALNRQIEQDRAKKLEAMRDSRRELVIAEVPTRG